MGDLLASDFARMMRSKAFLATIVFCVEFPFCEFLLLYIENQSTNEPIKIMDGYLNSCFLLFGVIIAIFVSIFIGSDYHDGTLRNKLTAGHSRAKIYISNFLVCSVGCFILQFLYLFTIIALFMGAFFRKITDYKYTTVSMLSLDSIIKMQLVGFYVVLTYMAVFLMFSMIISSRSISTTISIIIALVLLLVGTNITSKVAAEEMSLVNSKEKYTTQYISQFQRGEELTGFKKTAYLFLDDFLLSCQVEHLKVGVVPPRAATYLLYDCLVITASTLLGIIIFRKKDVK